jgi:hypothetical protein
LTSGVLHIPKKQCNVSSTPSAEINKTPLKILSNIYLGKKIENYFVVVSLVIFQKKKSCN